jgi:pectate lyase
MNKLKLYFILLLINLCVPSSRGAGISTNKFFVLEDNNILPPNETNFFAVNSNLLNASIGGGGGGGSGVSSVDGLTGALTGVLTNGETAVVVISNTLTLNSKHRDQWFGYRHLRFFRP